MQYSYSLVLLLAKYLRNERPNWVFFNSTRVMKVLGLKNINNTLVYTQLVNFDEQDFVSKVAWNLEEACKLIEAGFQCVCDFENAKIFKKRK